MFLNIVEILKKVLNDTDMDAPLVHDETSPDEASRPVYSDANPSFKGKLDLSSFGFPAKASHSETALVNETNIKTEVQNRVAGLRKRKAVPAKEPSVRKRKSNGYAPPETYAHLSPLQDTLEPNLICVFIGLNPGIVCTFSLLSFLPSPMARLICLPFQQTAETGHAYAHRSNHFWHLLHNSGLTPSPSKLPPSATSSLPSLYNLGNTNIVSRPSRNGAELKPAELDAGVAILEEKVAKFRPECVCIVGKSIWESIWRVRYKKRLGKEFTYGWQDDERMGVVDGEWEGARIFVATTTSALAASMRLAEKEEIWKELGNWVQQTRADRGVLPAVKTE